MRRPVRSNSQVRVEPGARTWCVQAYEKWRLWLAADRTGGTGILEDGQIQTWNRSGHLRGGFGGVPQAGLPVEAGVKGTSFHLSMHSDGHKRQQYNTMFHDCPIGGWPLQPVHLTTCLHTAYGLFKARSAVRTGTIGLSDDSEITGVHSMRPAKHAVSLISPERSSSQPYARAHTVYAD
jgi:hypothetical protein